MFNSFEWGIFLEDEILFFLLPIGVNLLQTQANLLQQCFMKTLKKLIVSCSVCCFSIYVVIINVNLPSFTIYCIIFAVDCHCMSFQTFFASFYTPSKAGKMLIHLCGTGLPLLNHSIFIMHAFFFNRGHNHYYYEWIQSLYKCRLKPLLWQIVPISMSECACMKADYV